MVAITYDAPELQQTFVAAASIGYPFISDIDAATMQALGILKELCFEDPLDTELSDDLLPLRTRRE